MVCVDLAILALPCLAVYFRLKPTGLLACVGPALKDLPRRLGIKVSETDNAHGLSLHQKTPSYMRLTPSGYEVGGDGFVECKCI